MFFMLVLILLDLNLIVVVAVGEEGISVLPIFGANVALLRIVAVLFG